MQELTIEMLEKGDMPELILPLSLDDAKRVIEYMNQGDTFEPWEIPQVPHAYVGANPSLVALLINRGNTEFYLETLQHIIIAIYPNKYFGTY